MMFPATVAGSLPKPSWLAEPTKLWPQWRLQGDELALAKLDATLLARELGGRVMGAFVRAAKPVT